MRPITINEFSYKVFGGVVKDKLWEYMCDNGLVRTEQAGFSKGRQIEENLAVVNVWIEMQRRRNRCAYLAGIDLKKAFDSVDRDYLISRLEEIGWDNKWVNCVSLLYKDEETELFIGEKMIGRINRNCGIRQGCKLSPLLFVVCLNKVVDELNRIWYEENVNVVMYADDALILGRSRRELEEKINVYVCACRDMGLDVNREKSEILVLGGDGNKDRIAGIEVKDSIKYLGLEINKKG